MAATSKRARSAVELTFISTAIAAGGLVFAVSAWQIFKTGQRAIEHENRRASAAEPVAER